MILNTAIKMFHVDAPNRINAETELLATAIITALGKRMIQSFVNQSVINYREHFYNVLTGMRLGAFHDWLDQFLKQCEGPETKAFFLKNYFPVFNQFRYSINADDSASRRILKSGRRENFGQGKTGAGNSLHIASEKAGED